jgi:RND family efflux transporter MFP subunit
VPFRLSLAGGVALDDRSTLLEQLKIDRDVEERSSHAGRWVAAALVLIAIAGAGGWYYLNKPRPVAIQIATAQSISLETSAVTRASALDASGYVVARRQATVSSKVTGRVEEVLIEEGQQVAAGEIVARLDDANARARVAQNSALLEQQRASHNAARVALENATPIFERAKTQFDQEVLSAQDLDSARATYDNARTSLDVAERAVEVAQANLALAQRDLDDTIVRAPFAGVVTVKAAQEGEMVSPVSAGGGFTRTGIGTIVDMDSLEVEVDVSESFINRVTPGQDVSVTLNAYPQWAIPAHVIAIIPTADRAKATVRVRVAFDQRDPRILPEMGVRVAFLAADAGEPSSAATEVVVVPEGAVDANGDTGTIFVVSENTLERRVVRLGGRLPDGGRIILSGISAGTRLALADFALLADGASFRIESPGEAR